MQGRIFVFCCPFDIMFHLDFQLMKKIGVCGPILCGWMYVLSNT